MKIKELIIRKIVTSALRIETDYFLRIKEMVEVISGMSSLKNVCRSSILLVLHFKTSLIPHTES